MAQLLLIDAGNTRTKWAAARPHGEIKVRGEMATIAFDDIAACKLAAQFPDRRAVLACVVPALVSRFQRAFGRRLHLVTSKSPGLSIARIYSRPAELGADRIAVAIAAHDDGHWPAIIVSCGTATAITVLNARGQLCGGVIAPGLQAQLAALLGATAQLPATALRAPRRLPAASTREAIRAGVLLSFQGGVREMVERLTKSFSANSPPRILLTGGDAPHLTKIFGRRAEVRPLLVFEGLRIMGARLFFASAS